MLLQFFLIFLQFIFIVTVDHSKFKKCDQSSFCKRNRNLIPNNTNWEVDSNSVHVTGDHFGVEAVIKNLNSDYSLKLILTSLLDDGSILRVFIDELKSERPRYQAKDSLKESVPKTKLHLGQIGLKNFKINFGKKNNLYSAIIYYKPFKIDVYSGNDLIVSLNDRNLFEYEHFRKKEAVAEDVLAKQVSDGLWEETFDKWTDTKPYGPMSVGLDISFIGFDNVYGIPEHADSFSLKDTKGHSDPYRLYNLDVFEYELNSPMALYGSVPMMLAHSIKRTIGLLWLNPSETWIDVETKDSKLTHWFSETGVIDLYLMVGETFEDVMEQNANLTGTTFLPPHFAIGYHQSRWNYFSENEVLEIDKKFEDNNIAVDAIWLDVEYTEARLKKYFTWDPINFPDPQKLTSTLNSKGKRLITIIDPHLKKHVGYQVFNEAQKNHYLVKTKDSQDYNGWCWPGESVWPDFTNPSVLHWWGEKFKPSFFPGFEGGIVDIWNDMNEPSVFNGPEVTMPKDLIHYNGFEHRDIHNIYGYLMTKGTYQGLKSYRPNIRPFILTRSFFVGSQKYCAAWTGDNMSKWTHLKASIPMILSLSSVGISFSGADVPGFFYDPESEELVIRWYQAGAFQPFFRAHAHIETKNREPWTFSNQTKNLISNAIKLRQSIMPYMYTLFYENHIKGMPPMRPLWAHFPTDEKTFSIENAHLLGKAILVHPVTDENINQLEVYLPGQNNLWLDLQTNKVYNGGQSYNLPIELDTIPHFQSGGSIIPMREKTRRSSLLSVAMNDSIVLNIFANSSNLAEGYLYIDDGLTFKYKEGDYVLSKFIFDDNFLSNEVLNGKRNSKINVEKVFVHNYSRKPRSVFVSITDKRYPVNYILNEEKNLLIIKRLDLSISVKWRIHLD